MARVLTFVLVLAITVACDRPAKKLEVATATDAQASASVLEALPAGESEQDLETARRRWELLTPDERAAALDRYRDFARLAAPEKQELVQRARRMREASQRVQSELPADVRERLRQLEPEKRREAMRELVTDDARARGQEIRAKLPDVWLERLEAARPEERPAILAQFRERHLKRIADFALERLGSTLELAPEEKTRLSALPAEERVQAVLDLRKRAIEKNASEHGLPPGMTAEDWRELSALDPERFFTRLQEYRRRRVDNDRRAAPAEGPGRAAESQLTPARREGLERLLGAVQQRAEDVIELVDLPKEERRSRLFEIRRARCVEILRAYELVPAEKLGEFETYGEKRFHEALRQLLQPLRRENNENPWLPRGDGRGGEGRSRNGPDTPGTVPGLRDGGRA